MLFLLELSGPLTVTWLLVMVYRSLPRNLQETHDGFSQAGLYDQHRQP